MRLGGDERNSAEWMNVKLETKLLRSRSSLYTATALNLCSNHTAVVWNFKCAVMV